MESPRKPQKPTCVCVRARARVCVCVCARARVRACVRLSTLAKKDSQIIFSSHPCVKHFSLFYLFLCLCFYAINILCNTRHSTAAS